MNISKFFEKKRGTATAISLGFSAGIILVSAGATTFVMNTFEENKNSEGAVSSYYSAERGVEYALYDISGHLSGYEVSPSVDDNYGKIKGSLNRSKTKLEIKSRGESSSDTITIPTKATAITEGQGNDPRDKDWNILEQGKPLVIPLYIDNTAK